MNEDLYETGIRLWAEWTAMWNGRTELALDLVAPRFVVHLPPPNPTDPATVHDPASVKSWPDFDARLHAGHLERIARIQLGFGTSPARIAERQQGLFDRTDLKTIEAGRWGPSLMSEAPVSREWDITDSLDRAGHWIVWLKYTGGSKAMASSEAALVRRDANATVSSPGSVVARDRHEALAGGAPRNVQYRLNLPAHDPTARYFLRLALHSVGGTDSAGTILLFAPPG